MLKSNHVIINVYQGSNETVSRSTKKYQFSNH